MSFIAPDFSEASREVLVTPTFFPTGGNFPSNCYKLGALEPVPRIAELFPVSRVSAVVTSSGSADFGHSSGHIDWITIRQSHFRDAGQEPLPVLADGCVIAFDADGVVEHTTLRRFLVEGSFESRCFVRCDGATVEFSGNPARWGRADNVFGYSFDQSLRIVNGILGGLGLPPFSSGESYETITKNGDVVRVWTGATVSRLDFTQNYLTGSADDAVHFLRWLAGQKLKSKKTNFYGDCSTVDFGRGSKRSYFKVYNKGFELLKHSRGVMDASTIQKMDRADSIEKLATWCQENGLVRAELELKSRALRDLHCYFLGEINMNVIIGEFRKHCAVFERATAEVDSLVNLEPKTLAVYRMWQAGDDLRSKFSKSAIYRHRAALLPHGIDIFVASNVVRFEPKTRVIALAAAVPPGWYSLPSVSRKAA